MHCGHHVRIRGHASASPRRSFQMSDAMNRLRSPVRRLIVLGLLAAFSLGHASANGEVFKCVDASGKTSYQGDPCQTPAETPLKVQAPAPPEGSAGARP